MGVHGGVHGCPLLGLLEFSLWTKGVHEVKDSVDTSYPKWGTPFALHQLNTKEQ